LIIIVDRLDQPRIKSPSWSPSGRDNFQARRQSVVDRNTAISASGANAMPIKLTVNGKPTTVDAPADMPLLWVIRDILNLSGTKYGCGVGQCGACTVHLNGRAIRSCLTPISAAANAKVTTIEGLSPDGTHPLQLAWQEIDVPQCGYCQAGQIMSAAALLAKTPKPKVADIDEAMNGNLCRCGTYLRIREAIQKAATTPVARSTKPPTVLPPKATTRNGSGNKE
jgi:isoquinoline 1-oxidoreductase alpha subunit